MRLLIYVTAACLFIGLLATPAGGQAEPPVGGMFVDDDLNVHEGAIEAIAAAGITRGCNPPRNTWFCPQAPVTRAEMAAFLVRSLELPAAGPAGFVDAGNSIFVNDIDRLAAAGVTRGCDPPENTRYCPNETVTRGQMAAFLTRALSLPTSETNSFGDDDETVFEADIESLHAAGITLGCNPPANDRYCPEQDVTRAEMATFLSRALPLETVVVTPRPFTIDVVSREDWGAAEPRGEFTPHDIDQITIHHAGDLDGATGPGQFLGWQAWHHYLGWPDLAYHFIVGRDGNVYEGRPYEAVGDTATKYDPTGHFLIVVEGDFDDSTPNAEQLEMLAQMVAWSSMQFDVEVDSITGHRDHAATSCPGDNLYARLHDGTVTVRATEILDAGGVTLRL